MDNRESLAPSGQKLHNGREQSKIPREERSKLLKYSDPNLGKVEAYRYSTLKDMKKRIRLLRLISSGLENPIIDCELFEVEFDESYTPIRLVEQQDGTGQPSGEVIHFQALSWCWGYQSPEYAVRIRSPGGQQHKVRTKRELALALKYLRRPHKDRILWIDAICIYPIRSRFSCRRFWRHRPPETAVFIATFPSESENIFSVHVTCDMRDLSQRNPYG
jgi:hypothetical protein